METSPAPAVRSAIERPLRVEGLSAPRARPHFVGYAANLSETGIFVQSSKPRPVGQVIKLVIQLPSAVGGGPLELAAQVRWVRGYGGNRGPAAGMGMKLLVVPEQTRARLRRYVARLCAEAVATGYAAD